MNILDWFNPTRWLLLAGLVLALTAGYFAWSDHIGDVREAKVRAEYAAQVVKVDARREAVAAPIAAKQEAAQIKIRTVFKTIIKEVPVYVKSTDCPMPGGFRVLHDAAANGAVPDPAAVADAAPAPTTDVAATVADNYGIYFETAERLSGLQQWVKDQQALTIKKP